MFRIHRLADEVSQKLRCDSHSDWQLLNTETNGCGHTWLPQLISIILSTQEDGTNQ